MVEHQNVSFIIRNKLVKVSLHAADVMMDFMEALLVMFWSLMNMKEIKNVKKSNIA